jgi:hypothetical protein
MNRGNIVRAISIPNNETRYALSMEYEVIDTSFDGIKLQGQDTFINRRHFAIVAESWIDYRLTQLEQKVVELETELQIAIL